MSTDLEEVSAPFRAMCEALAAALSSYVVVPPSPDDSLRDARVLTVRCGTAEVEIIERGGSEFFCLSYEVAEGQDPDDSLEFGDVYDLADPDCFAKLSRYLARYGITLDPEAL